MKLALRASEPTRGWVCGVAARPDHLKFAGKLPGALLFDGSTELLDFVLKYRDAILKTDVELLIAQVDLTREVKEIW